MQSFDLYGPLPTGTTVLEASAGTGKTFTVGALVTRYVAEGEARLDEMLVITFGRMASQELRERVREQLVEAQRELADPAAARQKDGLLAHLAQGDDAQVATRRARITDALAGFDAATIATTHQFCQLVLRSLGVAGDSDSGVELVEDLDELVVEVVGDLYLREFGESDDPPPFSAATALTLGRAAVSDPQARLGPDDADPGSVDALRVSFVEDVRIEIERRKQRLGILSYDDLLSRLATALAHEGAPARDRMRQRWSIVLVDEFQDTDPVQWDVLNHAFSGHATLVLIGDPKQAIYGFRGGDVITYLEAASTAGESRTLATNHRSDAPLVDALQVLTRGAQLGDERITVHDVDAQHVGSRLAGAPDPHPFRLRVLSGGDGGKVPIAQLRDRIAIDLADDVAALVASGATFHDGQKERAVRPGDVAILLRWRTGVDLFRAALRQRGIASVVTGGDSVLLSPAADEWLTLLESLERQTSRRVRAVALSSLVGHSPASLDAGGEELADDVAEQVRRWLDLFRAQGIAAVHEAVTSAGLAARVLARPEGERHLTDLHHIGQLLHDVAHRERLGLAALLEWFRRERRRDRGTSERPRRLESDAAAVQVVTIHGSKGLQYPIVYLPMHFDCYVRDEEVPLFHDGSVRMRHVGAEPSAEVAAAVRAEAAAEELRLTYVALTRAQSQVVAWWAPSHNAGRSGLTRLLLGRGPGQPLVPQSMDTPSPKAAAERLAAWQEVGAVHLETVGPAGDVVVPPSLPEPPVLDIRTLDRPIDTTWRRTSYSGLIRAEQVAVVPTSEPEVPGTVDEEQVEEETEPLPVVAPDASGGPLSPMAELPAGAEFGSLVHAVLEHADVTVPDVEAELLRHVTEQRRWWSIDVPAADLAQALVPMQLTPLGPLAGNLRLSDLGPSDRLSELDFELPLAGGDRSSSARASVLGGVADAMRRHLPDDDPMRAYADRLETPSLGEQVLRGYLGGSIDVVLRVPAGDTSRYLVVDYKTNMLGDPDLPLTALDYTPERMAEAMMHSHYPLQAMLYSVVVHRYLRWRVAHYDPERHLGGILYLFVRGMCGPETPFVDGVPCGVFSWRPPAALVADLSELLAGSPVDSGVTP